MTLTDLELFLDLGDLHHLLAQLERRGDWICTRQRHERRAGQRLVGVETRQRALQRVRALPVLAVVALAVDCVWVVDHVTARQKQLYDLVVVPASVIAAQRRYGVVLNTSDNTDHSYSGWHGAHWLIGPGLAGLAQGCRCALPLQAWAGAYFGGLPHSLLYNL